jgi:hypothetical protein
MYSLTKYLGFPEADFKFYTLKDLKIKIFFLKNLMK